MSSASTKVGGVVVTYHPDGDFSARLAAIVREVGSLIVVDNSGIGSAPEELRRLSAAIGCELIANPENLGLAAALNQGFRRHAERGLEWIVAFDQDSVPGKGFVAALLATAVGVDGKSSAAIVGANWRDEARPDVPSRHLRRHAWLPVAFRRVVAEADLDEVACVITSGSLFHAPTWRKLGGFDEALFLDLVDSDYCLRAAKAGHAVRVAAAARLRHRRGSKQPVTFLGGKFWPAFMPPARLRYLFRNRILLVPRHLGHAPHWIAFEIVYAAKIFGEILLLEPNKAAKLSACAHGTLDGVLGRTGKITEAMTE